MIELLQNLWHLTLSAAPWLLLGLVMAGVVKALSTRIPLARWLSGNSTGSTVRAALIGAPLPLCSCGVVPAALGLRDSGAGRGPTVSFLIATPETGVDSISLSYGLLGPLYAIVRPIAAIFSAIATGLLAGRWGTAETDAAASSTVTGSCCSQGSCCEESTATTPGTAPPFGQALVDGLRYAFVDVLRDIAPWLLAGLVVAALTATFVPQSWFSAQWGHVLSFAIMLLIGIPMYVCASASTPMAAGFLAAGISPGAVLVFLMAGPATNIGTLGILKKALGGRTVAIYLLGVMVTSLAFGIGLDGILTLLPGPMSNWITPDAAIGSTEFVHGWIDLIAALLLGAWLLMLGGQTLRQRRRQAAPKGSCCSEKGGCSGS